MTASMFCDCHDFFRWRPGLNFLYRLCIFCHLDVSVESIERFICRQDQSNEEPLFIRPEFGSQFGVFHLLGFIKPMQPFNLNVFLYTPFKLLC